MKVSRTQFSKLLGLMNIKIKINQYFYLLNRARAVKSKDKNNCRLQKKEITKIEILI